MSGIGEVIRGTALVAGDRLPVMVIGIDVANRELWIDGYNALTTIESALSGSVILRARDGCYRDMASMHGTYRKVQETVPAIVSDIRHGPALLAGSTDRTNSSAFPGIAEM